MSNYENLNVWHRAIELVVSIYRITEEKRRSSVSIPSNISEGDELGTDKQAIRQFLIAKGSTAELYTQLLISERIGYISEAEKNYLINECKGISGMLTNLIKSRNS
jgi:four helix bundle protein